MIQCADAVLIIFCCFQNVEGHIQEFFFRPVREKRYGEQDLVHDHFSLAQVSVFVGR